jgi:tetratricopeptide (TPR) repeat protein
MTFKLNRLIAVAVCALAANAGFAADTTPASPTEAATEKLGAARALIAEKKWAAAIDELKRVNDSASADWNNLMGYSHRKSRSPDLSAAERYYGEALRIDPKHRGALEYSGELFLQIGDLGRAEQRLATLDKVCFLPCEEFTELKKAIASFKANGNKVVATN